MSLTRVLRDPGNLETLRAAVRNPMRGTKLEPIVNDWTGDPQRLGVAADLGIRLGLAKRMGLPFEPQGVAKGFFMLTPWDGLPGGIAELMIEAHEGQDRIREWLEGESSDFTKTLALDLLRLAGYEIYARSQYIIAVGTEVSDEDAAILLRLLEIVPWESLTGFSVVLNPTFGAGSMRIGGADADLFRDGTIIDIKAVTTTAVPIATVRQLAAYGVLAQRFGIDGLEPSSPVEEVGIYHARSGRLVEWPLTDCFTDGGADVLWALLDSYDVADVVSD